MGRVDSTTWYKRIADIPGLGYAGENERRQKLKGATATPRIVRYDFDGKVVESLSWDRPDGSGSSSPVADVSLRDRESPTQVREKILDGLELPGTPADYHFLIQGAHDYLWGLRRQHPDQYPMIEWLCLLNLRLIEAVPEIIWLDDTPTGYLRAIAFERLLGLYATEGFEKEMLEVSSRITKLTGETGLDDLRYLARRN